MPKGLIIIKNSEENEVWFSVRNGEGPSSSGEITNVDSFKGGDQVDATGIGCSFNAGFLRKWVQRKHSRTDDFMCFGKVLEAVQFGCATAKFVFEKKGAFVRGITMEMVEDLVNRSYWCFCCCLVLTCYFSYFSVFFAYNDNNDKLAVF